MVILNILVVNKHTLCKSFSSVFKIKKTFLVLIHDNDTCIRNVNKLKINQSFKLLSRVTIHFQYNYYLYYLVELVN